MSAKDPMNELSDDQLTPADREVEAALRGLRPVQPAGSRDALMFEAGRRVGRRPLIYWRAATGALAACLAVTFLLPGRDPPDHFAETRARSTVVPQPLRGVPEYPAAPEQFAYLELRTRVLNDGVDAIPKPQGGGDAAVPTLNPLSTTRP